MIRQLLLLSAIFLLVQAKPETGKKLVHDRLSGKTKGEIRGDVEFLKDGGIRSRGGYIVFDAGKELTSGYFEAKISHWTAPAQNIAKSHPLSGWQNKDQYTHNVQRGAFWNWRIGTGYKPFKVLASPRGIEQREEKRCGEIEKVNWKLTEKHLYRVEWQNGNVRFLFDGKEISAFKFESFTLRYFTAGKDEWYGIPDPAPVISDIRIGEL